MDGALAFPMQEGEVGAALVAVNERLAIAELSITREDALMLMALRAESLAEVERVEFGPPTLATIAEAVASSPFLSQGNVADVLAELQSAFYMLRDDLPVDVPDAEIVEALRGCFHTRTSWCMLGAEDAPIFHMAMHRAAHYYPGPRGVRRGLRDPFATTRSRTAIVLRKR